MKGESSLKGGSSHKISTHLHERPVPATLHRRNSKELHQSNTQKHQQSILYKRFLNECRDSWWGAGRPERELVVPAMTRALSECIRDFPSCSQLCVKFLGTPWFRRWVIRSLWSLGWRIIVWWSRITKRNEDVFLGSVTAASRHNTTLIHLPQRNLLLHNLWIHLFSVLFSLATWTKIIVFVDEMMMCALIDWFDTISVYSQDLSGCTLLHNII